MPTAGMHGEETLNTIGSVMCIATAASWHADLLCPFVRTLAVVIDRPPSGRSTARRGPVATAI